MTLNKLKKRYKSNYYFIFKLRKSFRKTRDLLEESANGNEAELIGEINTMFYQLEEKTEKLFERRFANEISYEIKSEIWNKER